MGGEDFALVTEAEGYALRFRLVELWGELMNKLEIARGQEIVYNGRGQERK